MKKYVKLDERSVFLVSLENVNGKTKLSLTDRTSHDESYYCPECPQRFANTSIYVDKYRLLELADYIYEYCQETDK